MLQVGIGDKNILLYWLQCYFALVSSGLCRCLKLSFFFFLGHFLEITLLGCSGYGCPNWSHSIPSQLLHLMVWFQTVLKWSCIWKECPLSGRSPYERLLGTCVLKQTCLTHFLWECRFFLKPSDLLCWYSQYQLVGLHIDVSLRYASDSLLWYPLSRIHTSTAFTKEIFIFGFLNFSFSYVV